MKKRGGENFNRKSSEQLRIIMIAGIFAILMLVFAFKLLELQVSQNKYYSGLVADKNYRDEIIETSRGEIYDRNGVVLASNKKINNVRINRSKLSSSDPNTSLLKFIRLCDKYNIELSDSLPVTDSYPYDLDKDYIFDARTERQFNSFLKNNELTKDDVYEKGFYNILCKKYSVDEDNAKDPIYRKLVGLRYDMEVNDFSYASPYVVLTDVDEQTVALISEHIHEMHGIEISFSDKRYYNLGSFGAQMLGRVGRMSADETEEYVYKLGYSYDAVVGKDGVEKAFEKYLHGVNGKAQLEIDEENNVVGREIKQAPKDGYSVRLTIDSRLQKAAENALTEQIQAARSYGQSTQTKYDGEDCNAGSVVVMNPNNGEILVCASMPGYDINSFGEDFTKLNEDTVSRPLVNRATMGIYPPGSTFKIATAAAALGSGIIDSDTTIYDKGIYTKYETYQPHCWIYDKTGETHGYVNVKTAIQGSCNYFFYSVADKMGIDALTDYATRFGLGRETGIEIPESTGILAGPEYRESIGLVWNPGDTLQAAIGQSDNAFTPVQLCSYMSTVLNGGNRYKATLLKSIDEYHTGNAVSENSPVILDKVNISDQTVQILKSAMRQVVVEGTAKNVFDNYQFEIGGKTGTAQVSGGSDTALFVGFAPYDNPQIVVAVVVENAYLSSRASNVAKSVFDAYFKSVGLLEDTDKNAANEENAENN